MKTCIDILDDLALNLAKAKSMSVSEIIKLLSQLFGEEISSRAYLTFARRIDQSTERKKLNFEPGTGTVLSTVAAGVGSRAAAAAPKQSFHNEELADEAKQMFDKIFGGGH